MTYKYKQLLTNGEKNLFFNILIAFIWCVKNFFFMY